MSRAFALLLVATLALSALVLRPPQAHAAPPKKGIEIPPAPGWQITGTSSVPLPGQSLAQRVEARAMLKAGHGVARIGGSYYARGDYYTNPGLTLEAAFYPLEMFGLELSATKYFSALNATADAIRKSDGRLPDSQRLDFRLFGGGRFAFAYGKFLVEPLETVVHLDASLTLHAGIVRTDQAINPGGDFGLSFQALAYWRLLIWADLSLVVSYERRTNSNFASGPMGTLGVGFLL